MTNFMLKTFYTKEIVLFYHGTYILSDFRDILFYNILSHISPSGQTIVLTLLLEKYVKCELR